MFSCIDALPQADAPRYPARLPLLLLLVLLAFAGRPARADVTLTLDSKDGDKISDVAKIVAHADSPDIISKVEFKVDDQLRFTGTSVPYAFAWDTITDTEGAHTLAVTATDTTGKSKSISISLTIDNELTQGAPALSQKAQAALTAKDLDTAIKYSRRALKADPASADAGRALAGAYATQSDLDQAITTLEKLKGLDTSAAALTDLAVYRTQRALLPENANRFVSAVPAIMELRQKAADLAIAEAKQSAKGDNSGAYGDALLNVGRYRDAEEDYSHVSDATSAGRQALAEILQDHAHEGIALLSTAVRAGRAGAAERAIYALGLLRDQKFAEARAAVDRDVTARLPAALIVAAYADVANSKLHDALTEARAAVALVPNAGEAHYALSMALHSGAESDQELNKALLLSPFENGPYLDYATRGLFINRAERFDQALQFVDIVLKRNPNDVNAKLMQILLYLHLDRAKEAAPLLATLARQYPSAADIVSTLAVYYNTIGQDNAATTYLNKADDLDTNHFHSLAPQKPLEFLVMLNHTLHYRAGFYLTPASLYPVKQEAASAQ